MNDIQIIMTKFEIYLDQKKYSVPTKEGYLRDTTQFSCWFKLTNGKLMQPQNVTPDDIREYQRYMSGTKSYKASSVNRKLSSVSALMEWAKGEGVIKRNPVLVVSKLTVAKKKARYLDQEEQTLLLKTTDRILRLAKLRYNTRKRTIQRDVTLVILALNTGLNLTEICAIKLSDIEIFETSGVMQVRERKKRKLPLNKVVQDALQAWLEVRPTDCPENDFLWIAVESDADGALSSRSIQRIIQKIGEEAGLKHLSVQMLRHTFAKNLIDQKTPLEQVAALLGYESLESLRIYLDDSEASFSKNDLEVAVESIA